MENHVAGNLKTGIWREKQKGLIFGRRDQEGQECAGPCWPGERFQPAPMSNGESLVDFKQDPRWSDLFPFLLKVFIHPFFQQVFIEQTHEKVLSIISHQEAASKTPVRYHNTPTRMTKRNREILSQLLTARLKRWKG